MSGEFPARVLVTEVGPRDGLQNEPGRVPTETKVAFVHALTAAGLRDIEVSSFVRPDKVPQLADADDVFQQLGQAPDGVVYSALVPNERGLERALAAGVGKVSVFTAASETFNERNINATINESFARFAPVVAGAKAAGIPVRGYVSVAMGCPYEGAVDPRATRGVVDRLFSIGCDEVSVGDTIGAATPGDVARVLDVVLPHVDVDRIGLHFHDTRGMAVANVLEGLHFGIASYDSSAAGLGGCPFAPGSAGNLATEDLVFLLSGLGIEHGVDLAKLKVAGRTVAPHIGHPLPGRVFRAPEL